MDFPGPSRTFWQGKRVLLTGHTGFKGSWLSVWLQSLGAELQGFALAPPTDPNLFDLARVSSGMRSVIGNIRDADAVTKAVADFRPEIVIHMAAQPLVRHSYVHPVETYATNVMGTVHVLEAVRQVGTACVVVNVTSDKCYENREWAWGYRENEAMGGHDPYSSSKGCAELVTSAYRRSFFQEAGIALATGRAGNVIGGGDWAADRLLPDILRAIAAGRTVEIRNPRATRPWQHVLEPLGGYLALAESLWTDPQRFAGGWNFGPHDLDVRPVSWVVERVCQAWGGAAAWSAVGPAPSLHEAHALKLDVSKAALELGWKPRWCLERALEATVHWHKAWLEGADCRDQVLQQIIEYTSSPSK